MKKEYLAVEEEHRTNVERTLGMPFGYLKDKRHLKSKTTQALLKILHQFPWMLNVAAANYDPKVAKREMVKAAIDQGMLEGNNASV